MAPHSIPFQRTKSSVFARSAPVSATSPLVLDRALRTVLCAVPTVMALSAPTVGVVVPLVAIALLVIWRREVHWAKILQHPLSVLLFLLTGYGVVSSTWAVDPVSAYTAALRVLLVLSPVVAVTVAVAIATVGAPTKLHARFVLGLALGVLFLSLQTDGNVLLRSWFVPTQAMAALRLNVSAAALCILIWMVPLCVVMSGLRRWRIVAALTLLLCAYAGYRGDGDAPRLALVAGAVTYASAWRWPRFTAYALFIGTLVLQVVMLTVPARVYHDRTLLARLHDVSWRDRVDIWDHVGDLIRVRPLLGYGFANSASIPDAIEVSINDGKPRRIPLYPHNVLLQSLLELGVAGACAFFGVLAVILRGIFRQPRIAWSAGLAMVGSALSIWCVTYPLWRSNWIGWLGFCAISFVALARAAEDPRPPWREADSGY